MEIVKTKWHKELKVIAEIGDSKVNFDSRRHNLTEADGVYPTEVFLASIIACSTITTMSQLEKRRVEVKELTTYISVDIDSSKNHPYNFTRFRIKYIFEGVYKVDFDKIVLSIGKSHSKYCPMIYMTSKIAPVQYEVHCDGELINKSDNWQKEIGKECDSSVCEPYFSYVEDFKP